MKTSMGFTVFIILFHLPQFYFQLLLCLNDIAYPLNWGRNFDWNVPTDYQHFLNIYLPFLFLYLPLSHPETWPADTRSVVTVHTPFSHWIWNPSHHYVGYWWWALLGELKIYKIKMTKEMNNLKRSRWLLTLKMPQSSCFKKRYQWTSSLPWGLIFVSSTQQGL